MDLVSVEPLRIRHYRIEERRVPGEPVNRAAERIAALSAKWRDDEARKLLGTKAGVVALKAALAAAGSCSVTEARDGGDDHHGSYRFTCEHGARQLDVTLEASGERAESVDLQPSLAAGERCLRK